MDVLVAECVFLFVSGLNLTETILKFLHHFFGKLPPAIVDPVVHLLHVFSLLKIAASLVLPPHFLQVQSQVVADANNLLDVKRLMVSINLKRFLSDFDYFLNILIFLLHPNIGTHRKTVG